jgi:hypothetical protein
MDSVNLVSDSKKLRKLLAASWEEIKDSQPLFDRPLRKLVPPNPKNRNFWSFTLLDPRYSRRRDCALAEKAKKTREDYMRWQVFLVQWLCSLPLPEDWIITQIPVVYRTHLTSSGFCFKVLEAV